MTSKLLFIGTLFGLVFSSVMILFESDSLPVKNVRVDGLFVHVSPEHLQSNITNNISGGFFNVDVTKIENTVKKIPWVKSASVRRVWPDTLQVSVEEQEVIAIWNENGLLTAQGEIFYPNLKAMPDDLPHLRGPEGSLVAMLNHYKEIDQKLNSVNQRVSVLEMDNRHAWRIVLKSGIELMVGRVNIYSALDRFVEVASGSFSQKLNDIAQVDLRYTNGFAVRWNSTHVSMLQSSMLENTDDTLRRNN